jgi:cytoskeletal protein CcmA (bactofilin family)
VDSYRSNEPGRTDVAHIGKSVIIKGELSGSEDVYLDGEVEGSIELHGHNVTVGPNGRVRANINAKELVILGKVDGNVTGSDRVELRKSGVLVGDIATQRIVIEDGAFFKGGIDIRKDQTPRREQQGSSPQSSTATPVTPVTTTPSTPLHTAPASSTRG